MASKSKPRGPAVATKRIREADEKDLIWLVVAVCALTIVCGYLLKGQCIEARWGLAEQHQRLCYNDIQPLYYGRGVNQNVFPYVNGEVIDGELSNGAVEYPVLTGVFMWASGFLVNADTSLDPSDDYLRVSALLLGPLGLLIAYLLARMRGLRALYWAAGPPLVLYAFHNWDLLVVAAAVLGLYLAERRRPGWAAVAFGIGAAFKMYPLMFVAPLAIWCLRERGMKSALGVAAAGGGTFLLINLPFMIAGPNGWLLTYQFHSDRGPNFDTIWYMGFEAFGWEVWSSETLNMITTGLMAGAIILALAWGWRRAREESYPFMQVCAALLVGFLLFNKVHSPQYALWLLPFFVLLPIRWYWWVAYSIADLAIYVGIFRWFYDSTLSGDLEEVTFSRGMVMGGVWVRAVLLVALFVVFLRSRAGGSEELSGAQKLSHRAPSLAPGEQPAG